ncbi:hypothetical protein BX600DRAFT_514696 [Xylariales sp. PMI_506]|nr:hypothetical protein BX600DRAFT_514696 [Xylariales sp. PMI_506]
MSGPAAANPSRVLDSPEYESDSDFVISDDEDEDENSIKNGVHPLGLSVHYIPRWTCGDAFPEFYQNWRDAIVKSFNLDPFVFQPERKTTAAGILITLHRDIILPDGTPGRELVGYIRWKRAKGSLELANFHSKPEMHHLSLGGTDKGDDEKYAGQHGEGFKLAALVFSRNSHAVRIVSNSHYWNFGFTEFNRDRFRCRISQPIARVLQAKKEEFEASAESRCRTKPISYAFEDVAVEISSARNGRPGKESDFQQWLTVALELADPRPTSIIRTRYGDLILDESFRSRVYLKGLLIATRAPNGKKYTYGYNFVRGSINRDRERIETPEEEAEMIAQIWEQSAVEAHSDDVIRHYANSFLAAKRHPISHSATSSYREKSPNVDLIVTTIKEVPKSTPKHLWKHLIAHSLVRTPQAERIRLFGSSQEAQIPSTTFSNTIIRTLRSLFDIEEKLKGIQLRVVTGGETGIDLLNKINEQRLLIHEKWLDFEQSHQDTSCDFALLSRDRPPETDQFSCDHIVEDLIELCLKDIRRPLRLSHTKCASIRRVVRDCIPQMPRGIKISSTSAKELVVTWRGNESGVVAENYKADILYYVILHKMSSCQKRFDERIHGTDGDGDELPICECPHQVISRELSRATFTDLDCNELYFPMVARIGHDTIFGIPPNPIKPQPVAVAPPSQHRHGITRGVITPMPQSTATDPPDELDSHKRISWHSNHMTALVTEAISPGHANTPKSGTMTGEGNALTKAAWLNDENE